MVMVDVTEWVQLGSMPSELLEAGLPRLATVDLTAGPFSIELQSNIS